MQHLRRFLLRLLCFAVGYRFHDFLLPRLSLPYAQPGLDAKEIRDKSRASSAVAGIFMAFLIGMVAALLSSEKADVIARMRPVRWEFILIGILCALFLYLALREERCISAAHWEAKAWQQRGSRSNPERVAKENSLRIRHQILMFVWILFYLALYFICPHDLLGLAIPFSGLLLILVSLAFLVFSVELYDTAGGWQKLNNTEYHFHMASIGSHCYLLGLSATLLAFSLLLCLWHFRTGYVLTAVVLLVLLSMTEIEREISELAP